ncbi:MAG: S8 family serine peptidase [Burkholderiaceae bacterium]|nr:S8 family serine peptidase [Aquabacterium sp.]NUP86848.1 S8 family serine peptidase [Burkholderiaceae bacterium]
MRLRFRLLPALLAAAGAVHATYPARDAEHGMRPHGVAPVQQQGEGGERDDVYQALRLQVREARRAHAVVDLQPMPLASVLTDSLRLRVEAAPLERALLDELGASVQLRWSNGIGQVQLVLDAIGVERLARSTNAWRVRVAGNAAAGAPATALRAAAAPAVADTRPQVAGVPALGTSVASTRMNQAHALGFAGAGAMVVIIDTGVQKDHPAFAAEGGGSRVVLEACFGTTVGDFKSICPNAVADGDSAGDSPVGEAGSGAPRSDCSAGGCGHGTHVAGIAAGASGMAPKAEIASVQLFSYTDAGLATAFVGDLTTALNAVVARANPTTNNAIVVNVGMHGYKPNGEGWSTACDGYNTAFGSVAEAVKKLHDVGIAVIAPTGNKGLNGSIAFPACLSRVVKVAAADNTAGYSAAPARWARSNLASAMAYSLSLYTPALWLAPGAPVTSAWPGGGTAALSGTSQAAPHVAGMYAALKAVQPDWSVTQLNEYVRASASATVSLNLPTVAGPNPPQSPVEFRYVLLPN